MRTLAPLLALLLFAGAGAPAHAALAPQEQRMVQTVEAERDRSVGLLETLVNQNSGSLHLPMGRGGDRRPKSSCAGSPLLKTRPRNDAIPSAVM